MSFLGSRWTSKRRPPARSAIVSIAVTHACLFGGVFLVGFLAQGDGLRDTAATDGLGAVAPAGLPEPGGTPSESATSPPLVRQPERMPDRDGSSSLRRGIRVAPLAGEDDWPGPIPPPEDVANTP